MRSETLRTSTPSSFSSAATTWSAWVASAVSQVTSAMTRTWSESTTSSAVTMPPASPTAVAIRPIAVESAGTATRIVIENPALGSAVIDMRTLSSRPRRRAPHVIAGCVGRYRAIAHRNAGAVARSRATIEGMNDENL